LDCSFEFCFCPFDRLCRESSPDGSTSFEKRSPAGKTRPQLCLDTGTLEVDRRTLCLGLRALDKSQAWKVLGQRALEKERASVRVGAGSLEVKNCYNLPSLFSLEEKGRLFSSARCPIMKDIAASAPHPRRPVFSYFIDSIKAQAKLRLAFFVQEMGLAF
jgi:hypothetical protein